VSQSLAGRTALLTLLPLSLDEVRRFPGAPVDLLTTLWTGGYPAILDRQVDAADWLSAYIGTYVERDVRQLLNVENLTTFQTFLRLAAGRSAQLLNLSALGADAGVTHGTARAWVSVLEASYVAFRLPAFHASVTTRLVKTPKLHLYDSGVLCHLLGIRFPAQVRDHPLRGAIFETWVVSEIVKARVHRGLPPGVSHFRDRKGVEVDVLVDAADRVVAVETKSGQTVAADFFASLRSFASVYGGTRRPRPLERVVVYGGVTRERRSEATVLPWSAVPERNWG
jgi:predicted AAA+ superfamily ATPase